MGQCCSSGEDGAAKPEAAKESTQVTAAAAPPELFYGVSYREFADLISAQFAGGDVLTQNTTHGDPLAAWIYTAQMLDHRNHGFVTWDDVESATSHLGKEFGQSSLMTELIETITRSKVKLRHLFASLDTDGGGQLSNEEFADGLAKLQGREISQAVFKELWNLLDIDGDNEISWPEFMAGLGVEDMLGLHPNLEALRCMNRKPAVGEDGLISSPANTELTDDDDWKKDVMSPEMEGAARCVQRFYRRNKARLLMKTRIWQATVLALDLGEEHDYNSEGSEPTTDGGSLASDDTMDTLEDTNEDEGKELLSQPSSPTPVSPAQPATIVPKGGENSTLLYFITALKEKKELPQRPIAASIIFEVSRLYKQYPNVGEVTIPPDAIMHVIGDLHGQFEDLLLILDECGMPSAKTIFLFNGDFVDRGPRGVEVLLLLYAMKLQWPHYVHLNRGNHEARRLNEKYGFDVEVSEKYDLQLFKNITRSFCMLPLAHIVQEHFFVIHGGLSCDADATIEDYNRIDRFRQIPRKEESLTGPASFRKSARMFESAVWSDPREIATWEESKRGAGIFFGSALVSTFLKNNNLKKIIRSHEAYQPGYCEHHDRQTLTVFSASNYCGVDDNQGCFLTINPTCEVHYRQYRALNADLAKLRQQARERGLEWKPSACEDSLRRIRNLIFCRRTALMHEFQATDKGQKGTVPFDDWVCIMQKVINETVPWRCIVSDLLMMEGDSTVAYVPFLERYQNRVQKAVIEQWVKKMMVYLGGRMQRFLQQLSLETPEKSLSYYEMCESLRKHIPGLGESSAYHIVLALDKNKDGYIDLKEFYDAFSNIDIIDHQSCVIELWEMSTFDQLSFLLFKRAFLKSSTLQRPFHAPQQQPFPHLSARDGDGAKEHPPDNRPAGKPVNPLNVHSSQ